MPFAPHRITEPHRWAPGTTGGPSPHRLPFRPDIEGLRGIAVLLVVAYHVGLPFVGGGFVGVDVFFVLSGFLITGLLRQEADATGTISLPAFYARRVRRLLPAATVVLAGTLLLTALVQAPLELASVAETSRAAAAFVSNIRFWRASADYFAEANGTNPLLHTWSLSVEEQFYLVCPAFVLLLVRRGAPARRLAWALAAVFAASWAASSWYTAAHQPTAFFHAPLRAWEFAAGALLSLAPARGRSVATSARDARAVRLGGWLGLVLVVGAAIGISSTSAFPGTAAMIPVGGTVLLLAAGADATAGSVGRLLSSGWLQWIGQRSYAWYLWHWPVIVLGAAASPGAGPAVRAALAVVALGLAAATYVAVETPTRRARGAWGRPWPAIGVGLLLILGSVAGAEGVRRWAIATADDPANRAYSAAATEAPRIYADGCDALLLSVEVRVCTYGQSDAGTTVVLFGDSHVAQWFPALEEIAGQRRWRLVVVTKSGCVTADVPVLSRRFGRRFTECEAWRSAALDSIRRWRPALVVMANSSYHVLDAEGPSPESATYAGRRRITADEWGAGLSRTLRSLDDAGVPVALVRDTPWPGFAVPSCLARPTWFRWQESLCVVDRQAALKDDVARAERRAVARFANQRFLDFTDLFCGPRVCPPTIDGVIAYRDGDHITPAAARHLAPALGAALDEFALAPTEAVERDRLEAAPLRRNGLVLSPRPPEAALSGSPAPR